MKNTAWAIRLLASLFLVGTLAGVAGCASTSTKESTGQYLDDSAITTKVKTAIFGDPKLKVLQISVKTFKGEVQLSGFVDSAETAAHAADVARKVEGVKSVRNDLVVK
jgi:osmotically-inducible protein OsmY